MTTGTVPSQHGADLADEVACFLESHGRPGHDWRARGACIGLDPALFFPTQGSPIQCALAVCGRCPVRLECLAWAIGHGERVGIWGGTTERTRRRVRRILRSVAPAAAA